MFLYSIPLAAVSILTITASGLITNRHREPPVIAGALLVLGSSIWLMMQALELTSISLPSKLFFYMLRYVGVVTVPPAWFVLAIVISGYEAHLNKRNIIALTIVPALSMVLILTNGYHHLMFSSASLTPSDPSLPLIVVFGPAYWVLAVGYSYVVMMAGTLLLVRRIMATRRRFRILGIQILLASVVLWVLNVAYVLDPSVFMNFEPSSLVISLGGTLLLSRIAKLPVLGVLPVAHEAILDSMSEAIFVLDKQNRIVDANPKARSLFGTNLPHTIGLPIEKKWAEWPAVEKALDSGNRVANDVTLGNDGNQRVCELESSPIRGLIGNEPYRLIILRDVTERKQMENALQESDRRLRLVTDHMLDMVIQCDLQGVFQYVSPSHRMLGYAPKDLVGRPMYEHIHPEDVESAVNAFAEGVQRRRPQRVELRFKHADGHYVWIESVGNPIFDGKGEVSGAIVGSRDITERRKMQAEIQKYTQHLEQLVEERTGDLAASERKYRLLNDNMADAVFTIDLQGNLTFASPQNEEVTGYSVQELLSMNVKQLIAPEDQPSIMNRLAARIRGESELAPVQFDLLRADGTRRPLEIHTKLLIDEGGRPIGVQGVARDVSERKRMEEKLRNSEARFREMANLLPQIVFELDEKGNYTFVNRNGLAAAGYTEEEALSGLNAVHTFVEEDREKIKKSIGRLLKGKDLGPSEYTALRKDGTTFPVLIHSTPIIREGNAVGVRGVAVDITERKRMEVTLKESEDRLRAIFESVNAGIMVIDPESHVIVDANPVALKMVGATRDQVVGSRCHRFVCAAEEGHCPITDLGQTVDNSEKVLLRADGKPVSVLKSVTTILKGQRYLLESFVDISERKRMEEELLRAKHLAAVGEAAAMVGHDLRNPLQATATTLYLAKKLLSSAKADERAEAMGLLEGLDGQIYYMDKVVSDLQDYARPIDAELIEASLPELIGDVISNVKIPPSIVVSTPVDTSDAPPKAIISPVLLRRVLVNLVLNAVQAMPKGGRLAITSKTTQDSGIISVQDTGMGIQAENLGKIFHPFFTTKAQGQGLGLAVCKRLVEAQGGEITVTSEVGNGSTFTIKLRSKKIWKEAS
jgi:PAS domain S-box-containing protein